MDTETFNLRWEEHPTPNVATEEVICGLDASQTGSYPAMATETIIPETDQMAAENLMYLSQDVVNYADTSDLADDPVVECVTEEVITDDWVISGGQDRVEVPLEHLTSTELIIKEENDIDVPLPTDQDEYTAMRPWPCDFCSRRFRKKAALMNHMVAHQNDRPHACNLCGVRYVRKCDLMNHLKVHAFVPDHSDSMDFDEVLVNHQVIKPKKKRGRRKKASVEDSVENGVWENMTSARTQQWSRRARSPARAPPPPRTPTPPPPRSPPTPPPPADPRRPFVCLHCGVGFAREKALQSHSRIHGGDSPLECGACGELCWSREALAAHARSKHPHMPVPAPRRREPSYNDSNSGDDMDFTLSPLQQDSGSERPVYDTKGPELFCQDCGVAFQRADLLRRHVAAAHRQRVRYKRHDSSGEGGGGGSWAEHSCDVCGETCTDALQLLAHAEGHARNHNTNNRRFKKMGRGRSGTSASNSSRQFPCKECGKVFGSRSSQQIHIRIHTGERPYACRFCWKAFADGGEKPYACAVCPRAFNQRVVLREHVRSHHSAPDYRISNGRPAFCCVVCDRTLHSSAELVQHLIQHCDANTALKRQPQNGPRKYKRRRKFKQELDTLSRDSSGEREADEEGEGERVDEKVWEMQVAPPPPQPVSRTRRRRARTPPPRPRMIHTSEEPRPRTKQVRTRRPPRHPADDLLAIRPHLSAPTPSPPPVAAPPPVPSPTPSLSIKTEDDGPFKCEMCDLEFDRRDALLLHVPVHI
ncbi:Zinc finger protein 585A [Eumeta japonica]|uniref:Zinc finger protein 585A n=1 Tax=Eumeta variegata TaxID=151549 RepID=A0A4C1U7K9_EUMVA|nr:Zinc finger protein 585A [Eumeta japonica]